MLKKKNFIILLIIIFTILISNVSFAGTLSGDIDGIDESKYPGIKNVIKNMQNKYNNFHFQVYYTGIDWTEAITMEYQRHKHSPKNLVSAKNTGSASTSRCGKWFCPICGQSQFDSGYYCASIEAIEYMMDPRNSLEDVNDIFQFKNLEYSDVTTENIRTTINKKYGSYSYINNDTAINSIITASSNLNLNGYSILAKIINEQGSGTSPLVSGAGYNGNYIGYYNFFNIGAYGNGKETIIINGLKYAQNQGWNSVESSIIGGSQFYRDSYVGKGQNTLYYQRFNVINNEALFAHQYQQDVMGAETSSILMKGYYDNSQTLTSIDHYFIIPVYENMPSTKCPRPSTTENSELVYEQKNVRIDKLAVHSAPNSQKIISILNINEPVKVLKKATSVSSDGNYWDAIVTDTDGTYGYVIREGIDEETFPKYIFDAQFYLKKYPELKDYFGTNYEKLLKHFLDYGIKEGRASSSTFDVKYYLNKNEALKNIYGSENYQMAYLHFINYGYKEFRVSSPEYDGTFYRKMHSNLNATQLMEYYIKSGKNEGELATDFGYYKYDSEIINAYNSTVPVYVFDVDYYLEKNREIEPILGSNKDVLYAHFLNYGINEGRVASKTFNAKYYLDNNDDLKSYYGNGEYKQAYAHFLNFGCNENRVSAPDFDIKYYSSKHSEFFNLNNKQIMMYYITIGSENGDIAFEKSESEKPKQEQEKEPEPEIKEEIVFTDVHFPIPEYVFDVNYYYNHNEDLKNYYGKNANMLYLHFINYGIREGRVASATFDVKYYLENDKDLLNFFGAGNYEAAYYHFITFGIKEGRRSSKLFDVKYYLECNTDVAGVLGKTNYEMAYYHYVLYGRNEGRVAVKK